MKAYKLSLHVELIIESPENSNKLEDLFIPEWLLEQLPEFITLPFDNESRALLSVGAELNNDLKEISLSINTLLPEIIE